MSDELMRRIRCIGGGFHNTVMYIKGDRNIVRFPKPRYDRQSAYLTMPIETYTEKCGWSYPGDSPDTAVFYAENIEIRTTYAKVTGSSMLGSGFFVSALLEGQIHGKVGPAIHTCEPLNDESIEYGFIDMYLLTVTAPCVIGCNP